MVIHGYGMIHAWGMLVWHMIEVHLGYMVDIGIFWYLVMVWLRCGCMVEIYTWCMVVYEWGICLGSLRHFIDDMVQIYTWLIWYMVMVLYGWFSSTCYMIGISYGTWLMHVILHLLVHSWCMAWYRFWYGSDAKASPTKHVWRIAGRTTAYFEIFWFPKLAY